MFFKRAFYSLFGLPLLTATLLSVQALAQSNLDEVFDDKEKPWLETVLQLPTRPLPENLLLFDIGPIASHSFAIDQKSLSIDDGDVIRYTIVSRSPSGTQNISFEGLRCQSLEIRRYAFGQANGSWSRSHRDDWEPIASGVSNRPQETLARDYLCQGRTVGGTKDEILKRIRMKMPFRQ